MEMASDQQLLAECSNAPPRAWVLIADWSNFLAGLFLMCAFFIGGLIFDSGSLPMSESLPGTWFQFFFCAEGALYAIGLFFMIPIMAKAGNAFGTMQFAILFAGGIFFAFSGLVVPACITKVTHVFSHEPCALNNIPMCFNAVAHFGITCFMIGTAMGQSGVMELPKNKFVSPFWGSAFYMLGAWTIGIFKFWGPVLCGGFMDSFSTTSTWPWWVAFVGAFFLTLGALIFGLMDGSFGIRCH